MTKRISLATLLDLRSQTTDKVRLAAINAKIVQLLHTDHDPTNKTAAE